ncbi:glycosyltransferase family 8 protein [Aeromonas sp. MR7]|nr:glycosyltransferase family 8 protein [Aeromonas sp. MR7]MCH7346695.1 glycosyltransferase family 8 protein [Aeromonas sp. MR7]
MSLLGNIKMNLNWYVEGYLVDLQRLPGNHMRKTIHVAFCIDDAFAIHLAALIYSLGKHLNHDFQLMCHILGRLNEQNIFKLSALVSKNTNIQFYDKFPDYKNIPISDLYNNRLNEVTYYRFAIPEALHNIEKVLFIDADMIAVGNISSLWSIDMGDAVVAVVLDHILGFDKDKQQERGISIGRYFNAGFMLMDLVKWRANNISQKALDLLIENNGFEHNDQDALNIVLENRTFYLDCKWNAQPNHINRVDSLEPVLVHFCGQEKPWHISSIHPYTEHYRICRAKTLYSNEALECFLDNDDYRLLSQLLAIFPMGGKLAIWGCGQRGRRLCHYLQSNHPDYILVYFIDKNIHGKFLGMKIYNSVQLDEKVDAIIVASIPYRNEIVAEIENSAAAGIIVI